MNLLHEIRRAQAWHPRCNDAPDTSGMNRAAEISAKLSEEQLAFVKQIYADGAGDRARTSDTARAVSARQLEAMDASLGMAKQYEQDREQYRKLETGIVDSANAYDTEANREKIAGQARADVGEAFQDMRGQAARRNGLNGIRPGNPRSRWTERQLDAEEALGMAGAAGRARTAAETTGRAMKFDAANLGRGSATNQSTQASLALNAGNSAVGNSNVPNQVTAAGAGLMDSGYRGAMAGQGQAANIYGNIAGIQQRADDSSGLWQAAGAVAGAYMGNPKAFT